MDSQVWLLPDCWVWWDRGARLPKRRVPQRRRLRYPLRKELERQAQAAAGRVVQELAVCARAGAVGRAVQLRMAAVCARAEAVCVRVGALVAATRRLEAERHGAATSALHGMEALYARALTAG
jgi:hypothetical protein